MASVPTIPCKQCGHVNEGERVYCHNCGTKLDRSVLPPPDTKPKETTAQTRKRVQRMTSPMRGFFVNGWQKLFLALLWALVAATLVQAARAPDGVPPLQKKGELSDNTALAMDLQENLDARVPRQVSVPESRINNYLGAKIKAQPNPTLGDTLRFERAFVHLEENVCSIIMVHSLFNYPLYMGSGYHLSVSKDGLVAAVAGGSIGRLPVHPALMRYSDLLFGKLWEALTREQKIMNGMRSIEVHKSRIDLVTKPTIL